MHKHELEPSSPPPIDLAVSNYSKGEQHKRRRHCDVRWRLSESWMAAVAAAAGEKTQITGKGNPRLFVRRIFHNNVHQIMPYTFFAIHPFGAISTSASSDERKAYN